MRTIRFTPIARQELTSARDWYERESPGLGRHFVATIDALVESFVANPLQFPVIYKNIRRALLRRFPYALMFLVESDESTTVVACFHGSRNPARWRSRT